MLEMLIIMLIVINGMMPKATEIINEFVEEK